MKKIFTFKMLLFCILVYCTNTTMYAQENKGNARIYFIGLKGFRHIPFKGLTVDLAQDIKGFKLYMNGDLKGKLNTRGLTVFEVAPGMHLFNVQSIPKDKHAKPVSINVESGQTYFIEFVLDRGFASATVSCHQISQPFGEKIIAAIQAKNKREILYQDMGLAVIKE